MTCELDRLHQDFDRGHSQHCATDTYVLVDQVRFYHAHRKDLIKVEKSQNYDSLILEPINV